MFLVVTTSFVNRYSLLHLVKRILVYFNISILPVYVVISRSGESSPLLLVMGMTDRQNDICDSTPAFISDEMQNLKFFSSMNLSNKS